ncbi:histidinol dehydrogenase [Robiginitomaculum antarcticum]|uniref:histidinol dehydrogenase n=1 Tax=Robiginitomaculum antarcticum TaxID=437507 RepID=UPI00035E54BE|nr:histidinol dehydrogenase [Robiginitomaculum antarcticum]
MRLLDWTSLTANERITALTRPAAGEDEQQIKAVREILADVKARGDDAVAEYTVKFDGVSAAAFHVSQSDIDAALGTLSIEDRKAIDMAMANIEAFHALQKPDDIEMSTMPGVICRRVAKPLGSVGLYIPGGTAPLVSTVMMLALPARIAGVSRRVIVSPPQADGHVNKTVLAVAALCGVTEIYCAGGVQAIGALAYGTQSCARVAKIFGPGNSWVAAAKAQVALPASGPAIDLPAGPSEAMVVADDNANPAFIASDLLSQAEHDSEAQVIAVLSSRALADEVNAQIEQQLIDLPRADIARAALKSGALIIADGDNRLDIINAYAPEHLIVQTRDAQDLAARVDNAGSIFIGPWTPESVGDYASGTNHTLPTAGAARAYSGVNVESFMKFTTLQELSQDGLRALGPTVERLAQLEGLEAHKRAVSLRLAAMS